MKKKYQKPYIIMESFQLDASVAASCSSQNKVAINHAADACILGDQDDEEKVEYLGNACAIDILGEVGGDPNDTFCYHGPFAPYEVFMES